MDDHSKESRGYIETGAFCYSRAVARTDFGVNEVVDRDHHTDSCQGGSGGNGGIGGPASVSNYLGFFQGEEPAIFPGSRVGLSASSIGRGMISVGSTPELDNRFESCTGSTDRIEWASGHDKPYSLMTVMCKSNHAIRFGLRRLQTCRKYSGTLIRFESSP